jgi:REP element-mobilizing transposase RayT
MESNSIFYRRNLPHYQTSEGVYSVVFRLYGSLPKDVVLQMQDELRQQVNAIRKDSSTADQIASLYEKHFRKFDFLLDRSVSGSAWLSTEPVARIVSDALRYWDGIRFTLICYCIMPNHVHLIISLKETADVRDSKDKKYILTDILHSIKRFSAHRANAYLKRKGIFWQHESYDHIIRDSEELRRSVEYVVNNPVEAGLTERWEDWKWTYVNIDWLEKNL